MTEPGGIDRLAAFTNRQELRELRALLPPEERILYALDGETQGRKGLLAATDRRVLFLAPGLLRQRLWAYPYRDVARIEVRLERDEGIVQVTSVSKGVLLVTGLERRLASEFAATADKAAKEGPRTFRPVEAVPQGMDLAPPPAGTPERELEDRIVRLERMRIRGSMTEPESRVAIRRIVEGSGLPATNVARALRRAKEEEAPQAGYEWSQGRGLTPQDPVQTADDPARALAGPERAKDAAHGRIEAESRPLASRAAPAAGRGRAEVPNERPSVAPVRSASAGKPTVPVEPERPTVAPPKSVARAPVEVEGPLLDLGTGAPQPRAAGTKAPPSTGQTAPNATGAAAGKAAAGATHDKGKTDKDKPSIWPPLPDE